MAAEVIDATITATTDVVAEVKIDDTKSGKKAKSSTKEKKPPRSRAPATHPPYLEMIIEAITSLKERTGSSHPAIAKHIEAKHKTNLPANFKKLLYVQLKKLVEKKKLLQIKNSYKLSEVAKKKPSPVSVLKKKPSQPSTKKVKPVVKPKKAPVKPKTKPATSDKKVVVKKAGAVKKAPAVKKAVTAPAKKATVVKKAPVVKKVAVVKKTTVVKKAAAVKKVVVPAKKKAPVNKSVASASLKKKKAVAKPPAKKVKTSA